MSEIRISRNYFPKGNPWTESTSGEPGWERVVHRGPTAVRTEGTGARRRAHQSTAFGRSGALKLTGGGAIERIAWGPRLGPNRSSGGGVVTRRCGGAKKSREARWGGVPARERRREGLGEVWGCSGGRWGGFYSAGGGRRGDGRSNGSDE
jgi:hypothetical protein